VAVWQPAGAIDGPWQPLVKSPRKKASAWKTVFFLIRLRNEKRPLAFVLFVPTFLRPL
jgi:hypothetical protein